MNDLLIVVYFLCAGIFSAFNKVYIIMLFSAAIYIYYFYKRKELLRGLARTFCLLLIFTFGYLRMSYYYNYENKELAMVLGEDITVSAKVLDIKKAGDARSATVKINKYNEKVQIYIEDNNLNIKPGYILSIKGNISDPSIATNKGEFNEKEYLFSKNIYYKMYGKVTSVEEKVTLGAILYDIREHISSIYDTSLNEKSSGVIKTMLLGDSSQIDEDIKELYQKGGIVHILAISGLHLFILSSFITSIFSSLKIKQRYVKILNIVFIAVYTMLTGASISTVRAAIMIIIGDLGKVFNIKLKKYTPILTAALVILIASPVQLFSIGFLLSFIASFSLSIKITFRNKIVESLFPNILVFVATAPIIIYNFYKLQGVSVLSNIFIVPFASVLLCLSAVLPIAYYISISISNAIGTIITWILYYYEVCLRVLTRLKFSDIVFGSISTLDVTCWYILIILIAIYFRYRNNKATVLKYKKVYLSAVVITVLIILISSLEQSVFKITFLDVKHGDCIVIRTTYNEVLVIDGGGKFTKSKDNTGKKILYPYLMHEGIKKVDIVFVTHPDMDHIEGIIEIVGLIDIGMLVIPDADFGDNKKLIQLLGECSKYKIEIKKMKKGDEVLLKDTKIECIYPMEGASSTSSNDNSLAFILNYNGRRMLFTGDIEKRAEKLIVEDIYEGGDIHILKVAHHGSKTSSSKEFIDRFTPDIAIISGDKKNIDIFDSSLRERFTEKNISVFDTYTEGMIEIGLY